jgi:hypothetical protein
MTLDLGTIASIALGGAVSVATTLAGIALKERADDRRRGREHEAALHATARRVWAQLSFAHTYFRISAETGHWGRCGADAIPTTLSDEDARVLSGHPALWRVVQYALDAFTFTLDAREQVHPDEPIPPPTQGLLDSAVGLSELAVAALLRYCEFPEGPGTSLDLLLRDGEERVEELA